jgi:PAS domain S-box-containing protein
VPKQLARQLAERFTELREREAAIAAELNAYQALLDLAPCPMVLTTCEGAVVYVNRAYCEMLSTTLEEAAVNGWLQKVVAEDRERVWTAWQRVVSNKEVRIFDNITFETKSGPLKLFWQAVLLAQNGYAAVLYHPGCAAGEMARKLAAAHG